ncbi:MAG: molybdopterin-binding/glycosyltransferase family 2 protein [Geminicoccaceae bacterium]|nr:molybdopterin-binding/glycosyltransferase family 2 protein [Geminicoccaceae bacterium]MDW8340839.1 molybdopterin-binding/glycosyltransferase family 2 protein [Geminicoccaceae bacterium]
MRFGPVPIAEAEGGILAHRLIAGDLVLDKGDRLDRARLARLAEQGIEKVVVALLEPGDVGEDEAAARLAALLSGPGIRADPAFTGRVNLFATASGVLEVDAARVDRLNAIDERVTLATLPRFAAVRAEEMIATVKIIPFAVPETVLAECLRVAAEAPLLRLRPYRAKGVRLVQTVLPGLAEKVLDKTVKVTEARIRAVGGTLLSESRCAHAIDTLAEEIRRQKRAGFDILLVVGASAITDRRDVLPAAIEAAGGRIEQFGMPVDPGNLLLLAELEGRPVVGLPGCARSPKLNGFDWVLERLAADLPVRASDLRAMGVGGLLMEIPSRPQPRAERPRAPGPMRLAAIVLAAGRSSRMGEVNKLLAPLEGEPMVRYAVEAALSAGLAEVVVVTGHMRERVEAALADLPVRFVYNPRYAEGLSSSLKAGVSALSREVDGAFVILADMPRIRAEHLRALARAFDPGAGRGIVVPVHGGRRGNPVLWGRAFFATFEALEGDTGARHLIDQYPEAVAEVEMPDAAVLLDVDTPQALLALTGESG